MPTGNTPPTRSSARFPRGAGAVGGGGAPAGPVPPHGRVGAAPAAWGRTAGGRVAHRRGTRDASPPTRSSARCPRGAGAVGGGGAPADPFPSNGRFDASPSAWELLAGDRYDHGRGQRRASAPHRPRPHAPRARENQRPGDPGDSEGG